MSIDEAQIAALAKAACEAKAHAYAPYSKFHVGAALLTAGGHIISGCNIENATFGATICAERSAIASCISQYGVRDITAIYVTNDTDKKITPCGICRQVIHEFGSRITIICSNVSGEFDVFLAHDLLPAPFSL